MQPPSCISLRAKVLTIIVFEALQLVDMMVRWCRTDGQVEIIKVALMYSDGPLCLSFIATLAANTAARGRAWRRAWQRSVSELEQATAEHEQYAAGARRVYAEQEQAANELQRQVEVERDQARTWEKVAVERHRRTVETLQEMAALESEVGHARAFVGYQEFLGCREAWNSEVRERARAGTAAGGEATESTDDEGASKLGSSMGSPSMPSLTSSGHDDEGSFDTLNTTMHHRSPFFDAIGKK